MTHKIKLNEKFCDAVYREIKTFEVRKNDRAYQIGDLIQFIPVRGVLGREFYHPIEKETYRITYVLRGWGIREGYVVFSFVKAG